MKIAIASEGQDETALVSPVSGRAPYYLIFEDGELVKAIKNPFRVGGGGAGFAVADMLSDEEVNLVIGQQFGEKMVGAMESKNMQYKEVEEMTVKEAIAN